MNSSLQLVTLLLFTNTLFGSSYQKLSIVPQFLKSSVTRPLTTTPTSRHAWEPYLDPFIEENALVGKFIIAAIVGNKKSVSSCLKKGVNPNIRLKKFSHNPTVLHVAHPAVLKTIIADGRTDIRIRRSGSIPTAFGQHLFNCFLISQHHEETTELLSPFLASSFSPTGLSEAEVREEQKALEIFIEHSFKECLPEKKKELAATVDALLTRNKTK